MFLSIKAKIMKIKNINSFLQLQAIVGILLLYVILKKVCCNRQ